jgi:hypothetical protein
LLHLGGNMNRRLYGPAFQPAIPLEAIFNRDQEDAESTWPTRVVERPEVWRRSVYILRRRTNPVPLLQLFDAPDRSLTCAQRPTTVVPTQALALWNDPFVRAQAERIARRAARGSNLGSAPPQAAVEALFTMLFLRRPDPAELQQAADFLRGSSLTDLCQVLLMSNEFWYID